MAAAPTDPPSPPDAAQPPVSDAPLALEEIEREIARGFRTQARIVAGHTKGNVRDAAIGMGVFTDKTIVLQKAPRRQNALDADAVRPALRRLALRIASRLRESAADDTPPVVGSPAGMRGVKKPRRRAPDLTCQPRVSLGTTQQTVESTADAV